MKVAYVHGAQQRDSGKTAAELRVGLEAGFNRAGALMPAHLELHPIFYGDIFAGLAADGPFRGSHHERPQPLGPRGFTRCPCCPQGRTFRWYSSVLRWLGTPAGVASPAIRLAIADAYFYAEHEVLRDAVKARVHEALSAIRPDVVIGHSLGTVVIADVMDRAHADLGVRLLVTAGSPLGRRGLFAGKATWLAGREAATTWLNLFDPTDEVTGSRPLDHDRFPNVLNYLVDNDHFSTYLGERGGVLATHELVHYLTHPITAHLIVGMSTGRLTSPAEMAREVEAYSPFASDE